MVNIKLDNKKYKFELKTEATKFILNQYNGKTCKCCKDKINLDYNTIYNKLRHNKYTFEQLCSKCSDGRVIQETYKIIWEINGKRHIKTVHNSTDVKNTLKNIKFKCSCGNKISTSGRINHIERYVNEHNIIDTTNWVCQKCAAKEDIACYHQSTDPKIVAKRKRVSAENGRKSGKNINLQNNRARNQAYLRYKDITELNFYVATIAEDKSVYKIGITRDLRRRKKTFATQYTWAKILLTSDKEKIIELEYAAKVEFQLPNYKYGTEFIRKEDLPKLKAFVAKFNRTYYRNKNKKKDKNC